MGFFKKTFKNQGKDINEQEAQQSVEKEGSEWMQNQFNTATAYNDEDFVGGGQDSPRRARIFIAAERNKETTLLAASVKANNPKLILDSIVKLAQQDKAIENMILAAAAKLEFIKGVSEDKDLPKEAKEALIKLSDIL